MRELKLNAQLRAYSRAPYYTDWIRDLNSQENIPDVNDISNIAYARAYNLDGTPIWVKIDTSLLNKETIDQLVELVNVTEDEFRQIEEEFSRVQSNINISLEVTGPYSNRLVFTNAKGEKTPITLPSAYPDKATLNVNDESLLYVMDTPDGESITITDIQLKPIYNALKEPIGEQKVSGKLRAEKLFVQNTIEGPQYISGQDIVSKLEQLNTTLNQANKNIVDLENYVQGKGGFIDPHDFHTRTPKDYVLKQHYYTVMNNGNYCEIPDQTKIKNLYDGCIWVYVLTDDIWVNEGADVVVMANNQGVAGVVTGSDIEHQVSIDSEGVMTVNGLEQNLNELQVNKVQIIGNPFESDAVYVQGTSNNQKLIELSDSVKSNSVAVRNETGAILTNTTGINIYETINIEWLSSLFATDEDINSIKPILGDN